MRKAGSNDWADFQQMRACSAALLPFRFGLLPFKFLLVFFVFRRAGRGGAFFGSPPNECDTRSAIVPPAVHEASANANNPNATVRIEPDGKTRALQFTRGKVVEPRGGEPLTS